MTYRERREQRAERLREWAAKRQAAARTALATGDKYRGNHAFNFQPGHIPERARLIKREDRAFASLDKAAGMEARAANIDAAADRAIYSDDPDAIERLTEKIADLEAKREAIKTANAAHRTAHRAELAALPSAYERDQAMPHQGYELQNLGGNITRARQRLTQLQRERDHGPSLRGLWTKWAGTCAGCSKSVAASTLAYYRKPDLFCSMACAKPKETTSHDEPRRDDPDHPASTPQA